MPEQQLRYDDIEINLIKNTFGNLDLLKAIRKSFLQMPLSVVDQSLIKMNLTKDALKLLRRVFLPELEPDAPLHNEIDLWMTIKIDDKLPEEALPHIYARKMVIEYLEQQLSILEGKGSQKIKFEEILEIPDRSKITSYETFQVYSNLFARNTLIFHIEQQLSQLYILATKKEVSEEDKKKDSSK
ncbi:MAG: hypothetical protein PHT54_03575 [Candidatus Nanoarchaeia archaeon]|nr:hypothetical protein [Candidatus Nanoarchaeia archaeon]